MTPAGVTAAAALSPQTMRTDAAELLSLCSGRRLVALTGAGCSTASGIPDYRGEGTARRAKNPIQFKDFMADAAGRRRYWARATVGWPTLRDAEPNDAHRALAELEELGVLTGVITQNVDGLHAKAGSQRVVELHGSLHRVICLDCQNQVGRDELHAELLRANPRFTADRSVALADGDAALGLDDVQRFEVQDCRVCGGMLKPHVVFFGEIVPREVVERAFEILESADLLLVLGSSLTVFSGFRFVRRAHQKNMPIGIVNRGHTRGHALSEVAVDADVGAVLRELTHQIASGRRPRTVLG